MKTGNTWTCWPGCVSWRMPQWSPVMKTGNTEKGRADVRPVREPQWSPVMKTGNTFYARRKGPGTACLNGARS